MADSHMTSTSPRPISLRRSRRAGGRRVRRLLAAALVVTTALLATSCSGDSASTPATTTPVTVLLKTRQDALLRGVPTVLAGATALDPASLTSAGNLGARLGQPDLAKLTQVAVDEYRAGRPFGRRVNPADQLIGRYARLYSRIVDPTLVLDAATIEAIPHESIGTPAVWLVGAALYCATTGFPPSWAGKASDAFKTGADLDPLVYSASALVVMTELGCSDKVDPETLENAKRGLARAGAENSLPTLTRFVALNLLSALEGPQVITDSIIANVLKAQNADGGWSADPGGPSDPATTVQAMLLLEGAGRGSHRLILPDQPPSPTTGTTPATGTTPTPGTTP